MPRNNTRILWVGVVIFVAAIALMILPLLLPRSSLNRFLVAIGFLGICFSLSCLLNGLWDLIRSRGKQ